MINFLQPFRVGKVCAVWRSLCLKQVSCYLKSLFTPELMEEEHQIWMKAMEDKVPTFYEGIAEFLGAFDVFPMDSAPGIQRMSTADELCSCDLRLLREFRSKGGRCLA